ncbi:hypothetical protein [Jannaschia sp. 2305UL9-9]|uniref:hypothetical protein n=1 Tax=Jannaschia sp. 2305UL9-9 TaxID=3121638 RepID=UPI0035273DA3
MAQPTAPTPPIRAHIFGTYPEALFSKQFPGTIPEWGGVTFTFGKDVAPDADVLIVHIRASYSIPTHLPKERTVFLAGEPEVIHPYARRFLEQFGLVILPGDRPLDTEIWRENHGQCWFAGIDFPPEGGFGEIRGYDWLNTLEVPQGKLDRISVVTSDKNFTSYHKQRLVFLDELKQLIPDRLDLFGRGTRSIGDKAEALLPYKYHLALENTGGADTWTEKLSDPLLCWTFPFYAGCTNPQDYVPADALRPIDLTQPKVAAQQMVDDITSNRWQSALPAIAEARKRLLHDWNQANLLARAARFAFDRPVADPSGRRRLIRSERSLWPEPGTRGSLGQWALRASLLRLDPKIELRMDRLVQWNDELKSARRRRRNKQKESQ